MLHAEGMELQTTLDGITPANLGGFFEGWPNPPTPQTLWRILDGSYRVALAVEDGQVIGFVNAISDGVLCAYIPLLEVRAQWRGQGVASQLVENLFVQLGGLYMMDTACDDGLVPFYERFGMVRGNAMVWRDYARQNGQG
ncbi:GNAT family N-acetyltransferase [Deinococcus arenicola]|uniref:GNAT family N-acetyltransferase n=1 Tax=Deinococcus arenicola TaxID=2994950 RepID=A0ABU4DR22_9DEIO|nr:GNAT family N-acetyltransferase [Deinococcus sp. ZS9-10]MDV6374896.1 GNAT family N-acetyltransferase [Deinococcus sp. ZS9-10]